MADVAVTPTTTQPRFVPGAPPPPPLSKSQRKRRAKTGGKSEQAPDSPVVIPDAMAASLVEKAPDAVDVKEGSVAPELVAQPETQATTPLPEEEGVLKNSPIVELVTKRLKATNKKIQRISTYASTDPEKLNDDQKRTLKTLPTLEAVQKELVEVKKVIEVYESELAHELAAKRLEIEKAERARIADAVAAAERSGIAKASELLTFIRLRSLLATGEPEGLEMQPNEISAVIAVCDMLLGEESDIKQTALDGIFSGAGSYEDVPYSRIQEITRLYLNPPRVPTPEPVAEVESDAEPSVEAETEEQPDLAVSGVTVTATAISTSGSFHFMQASELEASTFEENAEWVERSDAVEPPQDEAPAQDIVKEIPAVPEVNGHAESNGNALPPPVEGEPIDWAADDEDGLPSIAGLHAKFGTSGSATPDAAEQTQAPPAPIATETPVSATNGHAHDAPSTPHGDEDDGFTQARSGGRGFRGRGSGFRGGERGGYRGGDRGGFRGHRGGDRGGFRGGFRGGERGGFRGGRGEWRGDGEHRGRGRGRGRGGPHGSVPPTPTQA
ncbi:hypothetical protein EYR40_006376 [Pleurotus pulmonarius]|nr:hypothetical protein EYR36_010997 [Pleurotus pulmonarius]KAF4599284.1 hypothetical protein EYR40_006376 [Pleurotus pulmonarius]